MKKLRRQIIDATSTEELESLKRELHVAEVDLNYTQYCPLGEVYVSLYASKSSRDDEPMDVKDELISKPLMWSEVEQCMVDGTLDSLRNRPPINMPSTSKPSEMRITKLKSKPISKSEPNLAVAGLNRRERRSYMRGEGIQSKQKSKSISVKNNQESGGSQSALQHGSPDAQDDNSDGGFFED